MAKNIHKGTELNNVKETWEQNERESASTNGPSTTEKDDLEHTVEKEASEYENANKEQRLLSGDRASVKDDDALQNNL